MIVIPMAGLSSRFKKAGYVLPKYMLEAHGKTLFAHSVESFKDYFENETFLFVALDVFETERFIIQQCALLGFINYKIVMLSEPTRGQAETVYLGVKNAGISDVEPLLIFNIDTFRPHFRWPLKFDVTAIDGYLETFIGEGANWSNVLPDDQSLQTAKLTAEKQEISEYCCTGLYFWRYCIDFCRIFERYQVKQNNELQAGELYIAPMYNDLIQEGKDIRYSIIDKNDVIFCGIPDEYDAFLESNYKTQG
ncbi:Capsular biosynthesis protein [uncultured Thiomicrorhabdus sp.]